MSILVIVIHTNPLASVNAVANYVLVNVLARVAVPFFFCTTGYFLFSKFKEKHDVNVFWKYIKKTIIIYIKLSILYFPLYLWHGITYSGMDYTSLITKYLYDFLTFGPYIHLWYLHAVIVAICIIAIMLQFKVKLQYMCIIAMAMYIIGLLYQSWYGVLCFLDENVSGVICAFLSKWSDTTCNGLYFGFPMVIVGGVIANKKKTRFLHVGLVFSTVCFLGEVLILKYCGWTRKNDTEMWLSLVPLIYFFFQVIVAWKTKYNDKMTKIYRVISADIFYYHCIPRFISDDILCISNSVLRFLFVLITTIILVLLLNVKKIRKMIVTN